MTNEEFVGKCIKELTINNISVRFIKRKKRSKIDFNYFCADTPNPELVINYFKNDFNRIFNVFVHEYSHFIQWKKQTVCWANSQNSLGNFSEFLSGQRKNISISDIRNIQYLEAECDTIAINFIKKNKLKVNLEKYIRESNAYILSYNFVKSQRKFLTSIYKNDVLKTLPNDRIVNSEEIENGIDAFNEKVLRYFSK